MLLLQISVMNALCYISPTFPQYSPHPQNPTFSSRSQSIKIPTNLSSQLHQFTNTTTTTTTSSFVSNHRKKNPNTLNLKTSTKNSIDLDQCYYAQLVHRLCISGRYREAQEFVEYTVLTKGYSPDVSACTRVIQGLCRIKQPDRAARVLDLMSLHGCKPHVSTYSALLEAFCRTHQLDAALKIVEQLDSPIESVTHDAVIQILCEENRLDQALQVLDLQLQKGIRPKSSTFTALIGRAWVGRGLNEAMEIMEEILGKPYSPKHFTMDVIVEQLCREGRFPEAGEFLKAMASRGFFPDSDSFCVLLRSFCNDRRWEDAAVVLNDMIQSGCKLDAFTCNTLIESFCEHGDHLNRAIDVLEIMIVRGIAFDSQTLNPIVNKICREGTVETAIEVLDHLGCYVSVMNIYNSVISWLCRTGKVEEALQIVTVEKSKRVGFSPDIGSYNIVINGLSSVGDTDKAVQVMETMFLERGLSPDADTYNSLINGYCRSGRVADAIDVLKKCESTVENYNTLIMGLCRLCNVDLAIAALVEMINMGYQPNDATYIPVVRGMAECGNKDVAKELLYELVIRGLVSPGTPKRLAQLFKEGQCGGEEQRRLKSFDVLRFEL